MPGVLAFCGQCGATYADTHVCRLVFDENERAKGADADLDFEFDPTRVPRPAWRPAPSTGSSVPVTQATGPYTWASLDKRACEMADATRVAQ